MSDRYVIIVLSVIVIAIALVFNWRIGKIETFLNSRVIPTCVQSNNAEPCAKGVK